jgi:diaminopimelate decarboxylase
VGEGILTVGEQSGRSNLDRRSLFDDGGLGRRDGALIMAGVRLSDVAEGVGTPAYVYNAESIRARYRLLDEALGALPHRICYAVKANSNLAVLRILRDLGAGADIVSVGELRRALAAGFDPAAIVFSGVGKTAEELAVAAELRVGHINLESLEELDLLMQVTAKAPQRIEVGIRVNPAVTADTHPYISTGQGGIKFGIPTDRVVEAARRISAHPRLELGVLAMHLGSQLLDPRPYREGIERLLGLLAQIRAAGISTIEALDIGGGLGIRYNEESPLTPTQLAAVITPLLAPTGLRILLEPGRFLVGSAGVLLTRVLYRKHSGGKEFVIVDAGMNDLVRPSHYQAYHDIVELEEQGRPEAKVDVVGPVCETGDFLALGRSLPGLAAGERLALLGSGAYGFVMSSNYNSRCRAPEVLVDGGRWAIVRPREVADELFRGEVAAPFDP